jgi:hypothetical protein
MGPINSQAGIAICSSNRTNDSSIPISLKTGSIRVFNILSNHLGIFGRVMDLREVLQERQARDSYSLMVLLISLVGIALT